MKQIIIRTDKLPNIEQLSYEVRGKLFTLLLLKGAEQTTEELTSLTNEFNADRFLKQSLLPFLADFNEDKAKYDKITARNRSNGSKGGRPRKSQSVFSKPTETQKTSIDGYSTNNLNHNIIEKEKEKETPSLEEVIAAANQLCITRDMAEKFFYYYEAQGWKIGNSHLVNWRSKLMQWKNNPLTFISHANSNTDHSDFLSCRNEELKQATIAAIQSSQRDFEDGVDLSIL